jgi:hypothetical protein
MAGCRRDVRLSSVDTLQLAGTAAREIVEIDRTIADFMCIHHQALESELPPIAGPRALLKARLIELAAQYSGRRWRRLRLPSSVFAVAFALILVALLGTRTVYNWIYGSSDTRTHAEALPNPTLTPGLTRNVVLSDLGVSDHDEVVWDVPTKGLLRNGNRAPRSLTPRQQHWYSWFASSLTRSIVLNELPRRRPVVVDCAHPMRRPWRRATVIPAAKSRRN